MLLLITACSKSRVLPIGNHEINTGFMYGMEVRGCVLDLHRTFGTSRERWFSDARHPGLLEV